MSCGTPLTDASVPTGMNTGVSTTPWGVISRPRRAESIVATISNWIDTHPDSTEPARTVVVSTIETSRIEG